MHQSPATERIAKIRQQLADLREDATQEFIRGNVRGSSYRHALAGELEKGLKLESQYVC